MKCLVCNKEFDEDIEVCPLCGKKLAPNDLDLELPMLKEESSIDMEKTRAILPIDVEETDDLSLIDEINKQIENVNDEVEKIGKVEESSVLENRNDVDDLATSESLKKRKNVLMYTGFFAFIFLILAFLLIGFNLGNKKEVTSKDYTQELEKALKTYYDTTQIDDVIYVMEDIKNDDAKIKAAQLKTRITCDSWILLYLNESVENKNDFEKTTDKYKELLNGIYRYAVVKKDGSNINLLTGSDYEDLTRKLDDVYSDSADFFDALDYYVKKDYDKAYYMFNRIDRNNAYYEKSVTYSDKIIDDIIKLLKNDINYLEVNIDKFEDSVKLQRYTQIEDIILEYNNTYVNVDLSKQKDYQEILSQYTSKVSEYTEKVVNSNN